MSFLNLITKNLNNAGFVKIEKMAKAIALALVSGKNLVLFGPGGHAKSAVIETALSSIKGASSLTQTFGEGMTEARLFGGLDFNALEKEGIEKFHVENSFLSWDYAVFEEMFDAPAQTLMALKDTLTAKSLRNGTQLVPMRTRSILAASNKEPEEISEIGPAAQALIERFPIQLRVQWESYHSQDFLEMFESLESAPGHIDSLPLESLSNIQKKVKDISLNGQHRLLAELLASQREKGIVISPRTANHAAELVKASAVINGRNQVEKEDFIVLEFLPGCEDIASSIQDDIAKSESLAVAQQQLNGLWDQFSQLQEIGRNLNGPIKLLATAKKMDHILNQLSGLKIPDELVEKRNRLRTKLQETSSAFQKKAYDETNI